MHKIQSPSPISPFFNIIKSEVKIFQNICCILEKTEQDGYITLLTNTFDQILNKEMTYAVHGKIKRIEKNKRKKSLLRYQKSVNDKHINF